MGFVVDKVALWHVFSEYFRFPCQFSFHRLFHNHLSSGTGTNRPNSGHSLKWTQSQSMEKIKKDREQGQFRAKEIIKVFASGHTRPSAHQTRCRLISCSVDWEAREVAETSAAQRTFTRCKYGSAGFFASWDYWVFGIRPIVRYSKLRRFGNCICPRPQERGWPARWVNAKQRQ
jgi:hypothetical protein